MSRVCIDVCFVTSDRVDNEFRMYLLNDLFRNRVVHIVANGKYAEEIKKVSKAVKYFSELSRSGLVVKIDDDAMEAEIAAFEAMPEASCKECDDPHIFALLYLGGGSYLFSVDGRLATCKRRISKNPSGKKYTRFKSIHNMKVYKAHRRNII